MGFSFAMAAFVATTAAIPSSTLTLDSTQYASFDLDLKWQPLPFPEPAPCHLQPTHDCHFPPNLAGY